MVEDGAFSHKIDFVRFFWEILNFEWHIYHTTGLRVLAILLNVWIFAYWWSFSGGGYTVNVASMWLPCLVSVTKLFNLSQSGKM